MGTPVIGNEVESEWFTAEITAIGDERADAAGCKGFPHAWVRLAPCSIYQNSQKDDNLPQISGTLEVGAAYAIDGSKATVGAKVLMRFHGLPGGTPVYQFVKSGGGGSGGGGVDSVQCSGGELVVVYA
jgi:hypothetical protein